MSFPPILHLFVFSCGCSMLFRDWVWWNAFCYTDNGFIGCIIKTRFYEPLNYLKLLIKNQLFFLQCPVLSLRRTRREGIMVVASLNTTTVRCVWRGNWALLSNHRNQRNNILKTSACSFKDGSVISKMRRRYLELNSIIKLTFSFVIFILGVASLWTKWENLDLSLLDSL